MNTTFIELVVDEEIVDLNRIPLPADTPIVDERFTQGQGKAVERSGVGAGAEPVGGGGPPASTR